MITNKEIEDSLVKLINDKYDIVNVEDYTFLFTNKETGETFKYESPHRKIEKAISNHIVLQYVREYVIEKGYVVLYKHDYDNIKNISDTWSKFKELLK